MAITFTSTMTGANADYERYLWSEGKLSKTDRRGDAALLDFALVPVDAQFVKLTRGAYITVDSTTYPKWYTGYIINEPSYEYLGSKNGEPVWGYRYQATSDEYILSLKPIGIIAPFLNITRGDVLKRLAERLAPGVFNTTGIQSGTFLATYAIEPDKKFIDIAREFCEADSYALYANDHKLYYKPQDDASLTITIDKDDRHFTPARLSLKPSSTPPVNDVTVLGGVEPQKYVTEYFVGTGLDTAFPLVADVFGADESVLLDEMFSSGMNGDAWDTSHISQTYFQVYQGYLNVTGGDGSAAWLISRNGIPLEGKLRLMHGEWDFPSSGAGIIGGLWSTSTPNAGGSGCVYGLSVSGSTMNPVVGGTVDSSQAVTISSDKRYIVRTIAEFSRLNRVSQRYTYLDIAGARQEVYASNDADAVTWTTVVTEVDPTDGSISNQWWFVNVASLAAATAYAFYAPVVSTTLHATVTGITVSVPITAALETASVVALENADFNTYSSGFTGWKEEYGAYQETEYAFNGSSLKLQADAEGDASIKQSAAELFETGKVYTVFAQAQKAAGATGTLKFSLSGTDVSASFDVTVSSLDTDYAIVTGTLTAALTSIPEDLDFIVELVGAAVGDAVYVDDVVIISEWQHQLIGPNEIDAMDGLAPIATIIVGNAESTSSATGVSQFSQGQAQLTFFKDSVTRTTTAPPESQIIRLTYRSAGAAAGRSVDRSSMASEALLWGDDGVRSVVRNDLKPAPRTSKECILAASAVVGENAFAHYEGQYEQWSSYFTAEPRSGAVLKFENFEDLSATLQAEEVEQVHTVLESKSPELFLHTVTFGKPDRVRRLLSKLADQPTAFQKATDSATPEAVAYAAASVSDAPDVPKPSLVDWDSKYLNVDTGQALPANGLYFEVRYTDSGWGADDGKNLVTRTASRTFSVPRTLRGRTFYIRQAVKGNKMLWSEDQTQANYSGGSAAVTKKQNPDGDFSNVATLTLSANGTFTASVSGLSGSQFCASFSIKGTAGKRFTATFGGTPVAFVTTGFWQRMTVPHSGSAPASLVITAVDAATVDVTRFSVEQGTLVETQYVKTNGSEYGPVSRYSSALHVGFPATAEATVATSTALPDPPSKIINLAVDLYGVEPNQVPVDYSEPPDAIITGTATLPTTLNSFDGCEVYITVGESDPIPAGHAYHLPGAEGPFVWRLKIGRPAATETWRLWFVPRNANVQATFYTAEGASQTPYVDVEVLGRDEDVVEVVEVSTDTVLEAKSQMVLVDTTADDVVVTLPSAASKVGRVITIKLKTPGSLDTPPGHDCVIDGFETDTIDGELIETLSNQNTSITITSEG